MYVAMSCHLVTRAALGPVITYDIARKEAINHRALASNSTATRTPCLSMGRADMQRVYRILRSVCHHSHTFGLAATNEAVRYSTETFCSANNAAKAPTMMGASR